MSIYVVLNAEKHPKIKELMTARGDRRQALVGVLLAAVQLCLGMSANLMTVPGRYFTNIVLGSWISAWHFLSIHEGNRNILIKNQN